MTPLGFAQYAFKRHRQCNCTPTGVSLVTRGESAPIIKLHYGVSGDMVNSFCINELENVFLSVCCVMTEVWCMYVCICVRRRGIICTCVYLRGCLSMYICMCFYSRKKNTLGDKEYSKQVVTFIIRPTLFFS